MIYLKLIWIFFLTWLTLVSVSRWIRSKKDHGCKPPDSNGAVLYEVHQFPLSYFRLISDSKMVLVDVSGCLPLCVSLVKMDSLPTVYPSLTL